VVYAEADLARVRTHPFLGSRAAVFTARSPGKDTVNEDAVALIQAGPRSGVLVVADGLGGPPAGEQASRLSVQTLAETVRDAAVRGRPLREAILAGLDLANAAILARGTGAATTLAAVEIHEGVIRTYHVGDAMFLVTGQRGKVKLLSIAHSPVGYAVEAGLLDADEAVHHAERNLVSNVLGAPDMRIEMGPPRRLAARDTLLIASDGLADNLYLEEIVAGVRKGPLRRVTAALVERCQARMRAPEAGQPHHPDDLSVVVFRLPPPRRLSRAAPGGPGQGALPSEAAAAAPPIEPSEAPEAPRTGGPPSADPLPSPPPGDGSGSGH
jgi:serine/threonine protein phosphatase PrpC